MRNDIFFYLKWLKFAEIFNEDELEILSEYFQEIRYNSGDKIYSKGTVGIGMGIIVKGQVEVSITESEQKIILAKVGENETIGELSLLSDEPRSADVTASGIVTLIVISKPKFEELFKEEPVISSKFLLQITRILSQRIRNSNLQISKNYWRKNA